MERGLVAAASATLLLCVAGSCGPFQPGYTPSDGGDGGDAARGDADACAAMVCPPGQTCVDGRCVNASDGDSDVDGDSDTDADTDAGSDGGCDSGVFGAAMNVTEVNTEHNEVTGLYASATGPDPLLFGAPIVDVDGVNVTNLGAMALTPANLQTTLGLMAAQTDVNGRPLTIRGLHLVVPIQLEDTAWQIVTSTQLQYVDIQGGAGAIIAPYGTTSPIPRKGIEIHVDPWLPQIDVSGNVATTWYLFADPAFNYAIGLDRLKGHEGPEICMKASNKVSVTGAPISPFDGDFDSDNVFYRVRMCIGGCYLDPRCAYAQVG